MQDKNSFLSFAPDFMSAEDKILKGASELFFKYGIKSITMDDIAKHLGMSKKTIYQHFKEKDEIVHTLMKTSIEEDKIMFSKNTEQSSNVVEEVFGLMKHMRDIFTKINPNLFYELQKYYPNTWKLFKEFKEEYIQHMVERSLEKGRKDGYVRDDIHTKIMARLRMSEVEMAFDPVAFPPDKFNIIDVQLALTEHFLYGICTLKGHKLINKHKEITEEE